MLRKYDGIYFSTLFVKFINNWFFRSLKIKMEFLVYSVCFYWKRNLFLLPLLYLLECVLKVRPLVGLYLYLRKKRRNKLIKIVPHYMSFISRWHKAVFWLVRAIKMRSEYGLQYKMLLELYTLVFFNRSTALLQKLRYYRLILLYKNSKHFKW